MITGSQVFLKYKNEDVLARFKDLYDVKEADCEEIWFETLKFLSISHIEGVYIPDELLILDEMWHNFILFTPVYARFCEQYSGSFIHHIPATKAEKERAAFLKLNDPELLKTEYLKKYQRLLEITYDRLGEETVLKWFEEYPVKYSKERIRALRKS